MAAQARRWMWTVNVVTILLGAWLLAGTANAIIANQLGATSQTSAPKRPVLMGGSPGGQTRGIDYFLGPIKQKNVFLHGEPIPDEEVVAGTDVDTVTGPAGACTLPVQILGSVVVERKPHLSLVTVMDNSAEPALITVLQVGERGLGDQAELVSVREEWDDPTLTAISIAEFRRDSGLVEICRSDAGTTATASKPVMSGAVAALPTGEGIKRISDDRFEVAQAEIDAVMNGGLAKMAQDVRIVPYFEGGVSKGFKLYSIKPGSLLSKIGLMNGDVISKVNGYDINSPEKALQIYGLLKNEKNVSVDLTRNGQNKSVSYTIR